MDINEPAALTRHPAATIRPITVIEYHKMGDAGIFGEYERVELIEGQLIALSPIGSPHVGAVIALNRLLVVGVGDRAIVSVQSPVRLNDRTEPEPDLALLRPREDGYRSALPGPADVLLLIEGAASSIEYDRGVNLGLYAKHGIPEFWIVNLDQDRVEVYRSPDPGRSSYASVSHIGRDGTLDVAGLPGVSFLASAVIG